MGQTTLATDSEKELSGLVGDDATATIETDPAFTGPNPGAEGSSENIAQQRDADDTLDADDEDPVDEDEEFEDDEEEEDAEDDADDEDEEEEEDTADELQAAAAGSGLRAKAS